MVVLHNNGTASFNETQRFFTPRNRVAVVVGDFNGDGKTDVLAACSGGGQVEAFLQTTPIPTRFEGTTALGPFQFNIPAGGGAVQILRGPELQVRDRPVLDAGRSGHDVHERHLPESDTLAPPPATPLGQIVGWTAQMYKMVLDMNNARFNFVKRS